MSSVIIIRSMQHLRSCIALCESHRRASLKGVRDQSSSASSLMCASLSMHVRMGGYVRLTQTYMYNVHDIVDVVDVGVM